MSVLARAPLSRKKCRRVDSKHSLSPLQPRGTCPGRGPIPASLGPCFAAGNGALLASVLPAQVLRDLAPVRWVRRSLGLGSNV